MPRCADASCVRWRPAFGVWGGLRLNGDWFCSRTCAEAAVRLGLESPPVIAESAIARPPLRIGAVLRHQGAITQPQLEAAVAAQRQSGLRLGAQLQQLGVLSSEALLRGLAAQANVSFLTAVDLSRVRHAPGGLSRDMVRALGLLPFEADAVGPEGRRRLHVVCTAPLPRAALRALPRLTGWSAEPYLVDDDAWTRALEVYEPANDRRYESAVVDDVHVASARIVRAAAAAGGAVVRYAECREFRWARVEATAQSCDVLVQGLLEERRCQVEPTAR